jgi:hypothetical protein
LDSLRALRAGVAFVTLVAFLALFSLDTLRALRTHWADVALQALGAYLTLNSL